MCACTFVRACCVDVCACVCALPSQNGMAKKAPFLMLHHFALLFAFTLGCYLVRSPPLLPSELPWEAMARLVPHSLALREQGVRGLRLAHQ